MVHDIFDNVKPHADLRGAILPFFAALIETGPDLGKFCLRKPGTVVVYLEVETVLRGREA